MQIKGSAEVPTKLYLQKLVAGSLGGLSLPTPAEESEG